MERSCFKSCFWKKEIKGCHSQVFLLGIFRILGCYAHKEKALFINNSYVEDPRLQSSGMTANWITARAFTLIELLVVVLIIGILAAVAVPQYQKAVEKSRIAEARIMLNAIYKGYQLCILQNGTDSNKCTLDQDDGSNVNNNLLANMDISLPGEIESGDDCLDGSFHVCVNTKDWSYGTDIFTEWYASRIQNGAISYYLTLDLATGTITCSDDSVAGSCARICGSNNCELK